MAKPRPHMPTGTPGRSAEHLDVSDQAYDYMLRFEHYVEAHWRPIVAVIVAVVVLGCVAVGVREYGRGRETAAVDAWQEALAVEDDAARRTAFQEVAAAHPKTGGGTQAAFGAARLAYEAGDYDEAATLYSDIAEWRGGTALGPAAATALGAVEEARGHVAEARAVYQSVLDQAPESYVVPQARLALGRLAEEAGNTAEALEQYEAIVDAEPTGVWTDAAQERLTVLRPVPSAGFDGAAAVDSPTQ